MSYDYKDDIDLFFLKKYKLGHVGLWWLAATIFGRRPHPATGGRTWPVTAGLGRAAIDLTPSSLLRRTCPATVGTAQLPRPCWPHPICGRPDPAPQRRRPRPYRGIPRPPSPVASTPPYLRSPLPRRWSLPSPAAVAPITARGGGRSRLGWGWSRQDGDRAGLRWSAVGGWWRRWNGVADRRFFFLQTIDLGRPSLGKKFSAPAYKPFTQTIKPSKKKYRNIRVHR